ncbi:MAG: ribonuclease H-like domain-containing protein [Calditrichia bacterium]|nr:ribonuclease H-like domain-containing protein [Calditrichia bacterium]
MDLQDKLKYYQSERKETLPEKEHHHEEIAFTLEGTILEGDTLPIVKIEKFESYGHFNPTITNQNYSSVHLPLLTKKQFEDPISLEDFLVFDLETTGLAGGTGTYPFLMGFGTFEKEGIRIYQYFLPDFGREISVFLDMKALWAEKNVLLSYNGKSYDYPLLRNRLILNRVDNPFESYNHLDLLHLTRRLWKHALPSCSLDTIEERIFSFNRWRDIDGSLIPQAYFTFLQTGDMNDIKRIVDHNQQDIISLARLLFYLHQVENNEMNSGFPDQELVSMFNIAVNISDLGRIEPIIKSLAAKDKKLPNQSLKSYSLLLKKQKKWPQALEIWQKFIEKGEEIIFACEELAKFYEHREINIKQAIEYTNRAIDFLNIVKEIEAKEGNDDIRDRFNHRLNRLNYRLRKRIDRLG